MGPQTQKWTKSAKLSSTQLTQGTEEPFPAGRKDLEERRIKITSPSDPEAGACSKRVSGIPSSTMTAGPADYKLLIAARKAESTTAVARPPRITGSRTAPPGGLSELGSAVVRMSSERSLLRWEWKLFNSFEEQSGTI
ncbi:unnamed protein product [Rangifer tarandus platyrhynchus]|uniref:Uncharacterized protein n=2 Tax=Rangifer tarandus platyrhynchus TaxID=3082113 RepID=A0ACB0DT29_RANTA|nr:unnamed protein product [Rangifer tarandus platyrhynchus]CAI9691463.1 unnamed protein product [Rangifer tarandus platyrhynchus]